MNPPKRAPGYMTEDLELRIVSGPPRYAPRTENPVEYVALESAQGELIGYLFFNDEDDAAGFRLHAGAGPMALNDVTFWVGMLQDARKQGLRPSAALERMLGASTSLSRIVPGSRAVAGSLAELEAMARGPR